MKKLGKLLSAMLVTAVMAAGFAMPSSAADYPAANQAAGTTTTFKKYFVVKEDVEFPLVEFTFKIENGTAVAPAAGKMEVYAGHDADKVTVGTADFTTAPASTEIYTTVQTEDKSLTLNSDEKYAKKTVTIDFTQVTFAEPGVYRYNLTENASSNLAIGTDPNTYYLDVYVIDTAGTLSVSTYILHTDAAAPDSTTGTTATAIADKVDGLTNRYPTTGLYFAKMVDGNQGSRDKYFKFTVALANLPVGAVLTVDINHADATSGSNAATIGANQGMANVTSLTVGSEGKVTHDFYLQNGQYIAIYGLTENSTYEVTENAEDYASVAADTTAITIGSVTFNNATSGTIAKDNVYTGFTNTRNGVIPTGVLLSATPVIIVGVIVVAGIAFFAVSSAKRKAAESAEDDSEA